jgi:hypothetical protein
MKSLSTALPAAMKALTERYVEQAKHLDAFVESHATKKKKQANRVSFRLTEENMTRFEAMANEVDAYDLAIRNVPITFLVSLVSQYDAFLGNLLRNAFYLKPEMLNTSQRQLTFAELAAFGSLDAAREYVIEKEVETVLRSSHSDQFEWMESRFGIPLRKELASWPCFIEVTERRNLFVHCDGVVSNQYLAVCKAHSAHSAPPAPGDILGVSPAYFDSAYRCLFELGIKLGQVLWRKLSSDQLKQADDNLIQMGFDLLNEERFQLAKELFTFGSKVLKKHSSDIARRVMVINHAIALKALKDDHFKQLIDQEDWSACSDDFQLAVAVLHGRNEDAAKIMKAIGKKGKLSENEYKTWPLFRDFRRTDAFKNSYRQIFGHEFMIEESTETPASRKTREQMAGVYGVNAAVQP